MKKLINFSLVLIAALLFALPAQAYVIMDNYIGDFDNGNGAQNRDVIGSDSRFDTSKMDVNLIGGDLTVDIYSPYFDNVGYGGTAIGDLFISTTGWNVTGSEPYYSDTFSPTPYGGWDYAVVLGSGGIASVYDIESGSILTSDEVYGAAHPSAIPGYNYRSGQEVQFDATGSALDIGTWSLASGVMNISIDDALFTGAFGSGDLAFHWAPTCANDVIEGKVPESSMMLLFGSGLVGLGLFRRRRNS